MSPRKNENVNETTGEVTGDVELYQEPKLANQELNGLATDNDALLALFDEWGLSPEDMIIGDVYEYVEDKDELIGVPLILVQWKFGESKNTGAEYVQIKAVRQDTKKKIGIFDSGLGIYGYLNELSDKRLTQGKPAYNGALAPHGLTVSEYPPKFEDGVMVRPAGKTYYFA